MFHRATDVFPPVKNRIVFDDQRIQTGIGGKTDYDRDARILRRAARRSHIVQSRFGFAGRVELDDRFARAAGIFQHSHQSASGAVL